MAEHRQQQPGRRRPAVLASGRYGQVLGTAAVQLLPGLWHDWRARNVSATIPAAIAAIERAGTLTNFRRLIGESDEPYQGSYPFLDTDVYKTLEGVVYALADEDVQRTREFYEESVRLVTAAQRDDGYLGTFHQGEEPAKPPWSDLAWGHELYNLGHLLQAALAASRLLDDRRLLDVAERFCELVWLRYGEDGEPGYDGHPEVEMALVELARETGDPRWLRLAELLVDRRGSGWLRLRIFGPEYFQDHVPLRELDSVTGHAVRMCYLAAGATDVALELGDAVLLGQLERLFDDLVATKLYLTGGLGSRHSDEAIGDRYELPSERAYAETCAAIGLMQWAWRLHLATGRADVLDVYERVLHNAFAVGLSDDGTAFFYDNPLQRRPDHTFRSGAEVGGDLLRRGWFGCACCPPNVIRWMAELPDHLATADDTSLTVAFATPARISSPALDVTIATALPWDDGMTVVVDRTGPGPATLRLRIPGWAHQPSAVLHHASGATETVATRPVDGWLTLDRVWAPGDRLRLRFGLRTVVVGAHPHLDAVRGTAAVLRGPIVHALEQQDVPDGFGVDDVVIDPAAVAAETRPVPKDATSDDPLTAHALRIPVALVAPPDSGPLYPVLAAGPTDDHRDGSAASTTSPTTTATLIPYHRWGNRRPGAMRVWLRTQ